MAVEAQRFSGGDKKFFVIHKADGINTESPRESIKDEQFGWLENLQPIADGNFRALYSNGTAVYTVPGDAPGGTTIVYFYPFNIGAKDYLFVVLSNGWVSIGDADLGGEFARLSSTNGALYNSAAPGTLPQAVQYGQQGVIFVGQGGIVNYGFWNGSTTFYNSTLSPTVTITNPGTAYTTAPTVVIAGGHGTGATAVASIQNGSVSKITITNPGSGYQVGDTPTITLVGGTQTGSGASLTAVLSALASGSGATLTAHWTSFGLTDQLTSITVTAGGTGYSSFAVANFNLAAVPGNWSGGSAGAPTISLTIVGGVITVATINYSATNPNGYFNNANSSDPPIVVSDNGGGFTVTSVTGTPTGTNYSPSTTITASGGGSPVTQATLTPVITSGVITGVTIISGGKYGTNTPPTLTVADVATTATATISIMPIGMGGTCVEVFQSRVWVGNGAVVSFTAPNSPTDFTTTNGGGAFTSTDGFLRREVTVLRQSNGFLYVFADSSINVISNVQTSGSPLLTTFNNQNVTPQVGTPWHNSVVGVEDFLVFANIQGVYKLGGSNVTKVSDPLDGIFIAANATLVADTPPNQPTGALSQINDKTVYILVVPVQGPLDGSPRTGMVMWDGKKWWVGSQVTTFTQVATQEINSTLQAWGNSGTTLNKMFTTKSGSLTKTWQTKLWAGEGPHIGKQIMRLFTMAVDKSTGGYTFTGTFDYRLEGTAVQTQAFTITQTNLTGSGSTASNVRGNYVGMTLHTTKDDFILLSQQLLYQEQSPLGG